MKAAADPLFLRLLRIMLCYDELEFRVALYSVEDVSSCVLLSRMYPAVDPFASP